MNDQVTFDDNAIVHLRANGSKNSIGWNDLAEVGILTTDEGPMQEDVFLLLLDSTLKTGCVVPQGAEGFDKLLHRLQNLHGFDNETAIQAMQSTANAKFLCWRRLS